MTATTPDDHHALSRFEKVALAAIIANTIVLLWSLIDHHHELLLARCEYGFLLFFVAELGVRLRAVGWRPHHFLARPWNAFDTAVIALAFSPVLGVSVTLLRVARLARGRASTWRIWRQSCRTRAAGISMTCTTAAWRG